MIQTRLALEQGHWTVSQDGDRDALAMFERHYSCKKYKDGRERKLFCGPGQKLVLVTPTVDALFVWRVFKDDSGQQGVNCAVFRNEGPILSSALILEAEAFAWTRWPAQTRLYTYVSAAKTATRRSRLSPPGKCFIAAGWAPCGITKRNKLTILEKSRMQQTTKGDK